MQGFWRLGFINQYHVQRERALRLQHMQHTARQQACEETEFPYDKRQSV